MKYKKERLYRSIFIIFFIATCCSITFFTASGAEEQKKPPTIEQLAAGEGKGWLPPSIEDLTQGKVKIGDLINKDNVDLVKDYLPLSIYECVKKGMVMRMGENLPPEKMVPRYFWEASVKNKGKAVMDKEGTVLMPDGSPWAGGIPFPEPKTGLEIMANVKFGLGISDQYYPPYPMFYINKEGQIYKTGSFEVRQAWAFGRLKVPPLGTIPGMEDLQWKHISVFTSPLELKGLGQLTIRHYDENKNPDTGFVYLPAFKRTIRVSATTWQDNMGGTDFTWGDPQGLREPYAYWNFKLLKTQLMLVPEPKSPFPLLNLEDRSLNKEVLTDHGETFVRLGWTITPMHIVEATPKIPHIYGKKILYIYAPPYWTGIMPILAVDVYDKAKKLWKSYFDFRGLVVDADGESCALTSGGMMYDLQTGHATRHNWLCVPDVGIDINDLNLKMLLEKGR